MRLRHICRALTLLLPLIAAPAACDEPYVLWDPTRPVPKAAQCPLLEDVEFSVVKRWEPEVDGFKFVHGAAICWHNGKLYASFGRNKGLENTAGEVADGRVSDDGGKTWGPVFSIDDGDPAHPAVSHGVFLSHRGVLWAFHGMFYNFLERLETVAYVLDEANGRWTSKGVVAKDGFWATGSPQRMDDGNWIMAGFAMIPKTPAAVAISHGDDLTHWDVVTIPFAEGIDGVWGESAVIIEGKQVLSISRWGKKPIALAAISQDYGRTWSPLNRSNLPMAASKPFAGVLSTGQRYLICTTTADTGDQRRPLTIAVSKAGEKVFNQVFRIRDGVYKGPGESSDSAILAYPYAVEEGGKLYVIYSCSGEPKRGANNNSVELAIIPVAQLAVP